jgi:hypothetical protein
VINNPEMERWALRRTCGSVPLDEPRTLSICAEAAVWFVCLFIYMTTSVHVWNKSSDLKNNWDCGLQPVEPDCILVSDVGYYQPSFSQLLPSYRHGMLWIAMVLWTCYKVLWHLQILRSTTTRYLGHVTPYPHPHDSKSPDVYIISCFGFSHSDMTPTQTQMM